MKSIFSSSSEGLKFRRWKNLTQETRDLSINGGFYETQNQEDLCATTGHALSHGSCPAAVSGLAPQYGAGSPKGGHPSGSCPNEKSGYGWGSHTQTEDLGSTPRTCRLDIGSKAPKQLERNGGDTSKQMCVFHIREKWKERDKKEKEIHTSKVLLKKKLYTDTELLDYLEDFGVINCLKQANMHRCFSALFRSVCLESKE